MADFYTLLDSTNGTLIANRAVVAKGYFQRLKGLLGTERMEEGDALVLDPCTSIHTFFMKYPIDVLVLGPEGVVLAVYHSLKPFRMTRIHPKAERFIELPAGTAAKSGVLKGHKIVLEKTG